MKARPAALGLVHCVRTDDLVRLHCARGLGPRRRSRADAAGLPVACWRRWRVHVRGARYHGSAASDATKCPTNPPERFLPEGSCVALASTPDGDGYWILNRALGKIYAFGDAASFGQPADQFAGVGAEFVPAFVSIVSTPNGHGYWVLALEPSGAGRVMHFGNAGFFGDTQTIVSQTHRSFNGIPVALAATPDGKGYWEVHSDGGVFSFGDAHFYGSMGGAHLNKPVVGVAPTGDGKGYWLVASDGGVFRVRRRALRRIARRQATRGPGRRHRPESARCRLLARVVRRRRVRAGRRTVLRLHGWQAPEQAGSRNRVQRRRRLSNRPRQLSRRGPRDWSCRGAMCGAWMLSSSLQRA